jgi:hypothetical protein
MTMPDTPIATNLSKAFDVEVNLFSKVTLNIIPPVNNLSQTINLFFSQVTYLSIWINASLCQNPLAQAGTNAIDIL